MEERLRRAAAAAPGFMPEDEGPALYRAGIAAGPMGPMLEIGSYCGKSAVYLGAAAREKGGLLYSLDHHWGVRGAPTGRGVSRSGAAGRGRPRRQPACIPRRTIAGAGLEDVVVGVVGRSSAVAERGNPLALVFIDGATATPPPKRITPGGLLTWSRAGSSLSTTFSPTRPRRKSSLQYLQTRLDSGNFNEVGACGSLRVLRRLTPRDRSSASVGV